MQIRGAGLTNKPALYLKAVAREGDDMKELLEQLAEALGLDAGADETAICKAVQDTVELFQKVLHVVSFACDIREAVDKAIAEGTTLKQFRAELEPVLQAKEWWGKKALVDPETGEMRIVQLGSPRRLRTIFDTSLRTAYAAGAWERAQRVKRRRPLDRRTRPL